MKQNIEEQKEGHIKQSVLLALGELNEPSENERSRSIHFWQSLTSDERFQATSEIVKRVHLARGGPRQLKMNRSVTRLIRRKS